jgi:predicted LPLAT superfamily acyltransferase
MKTVLHSALVLAFIGAVSSSVHAATPVALLGDAVAVSTSSRLIKLDAMTRYVNVKAGEIVRFQFQDKQFAVHFDGVRDSFELNRLAPDGVLDHPITAYVARTEDYPM